MEPLSWEERARRAREALAVLDFLLGEWEGHGHERGEPRRARARAQRLLDGSWLELEERLLDAEGRELYADRSYYALDPVEGPLLLHLQPGAALRKQSFRAEPGYLRWLGGPLAPRIELRAEPGGWVERAWLPGEQEPSLELHYRPAGRTP